ncbi:aminoglycoside phosphotransferase [Actinocorallia sp. API 0066]|uniref:aminoglycoside phosphotransferase n=1 Tax=Actinocorallia sp. API 0066 TaxID=2896846 RepID=UPI001E454955|nr:aminoglycoside phosphotransferase [Actinocorallia sp. API 0066]MCD0452527.1 aminoglycoside phosphotransferase [Actinocorallia sp. API 0066]
MSDDQSESGQRRFLRRILADGAARLGVSVDADTPEAVFGWRDRTIGAPATKDGTRLWLRATAERREWTESDDWTGNQDAADMPGIRKPSLIAHTEWDDDNVIDRAELMTYVPDRACSPTAELRTPFTAPDTWWADLRAAVDALSVHPTHRGGENPGWYTPDLRLFFGVRAERFKPSWATEHMDLQWSNITTPTLWLLDWESWGRAPAGYGAASLYCHSLLIPPTAHRVHQVFADVLDSPEGQYAQLCAISHLLRRASDGDYPDLVLPLHAAAEKILAPESRRCT